ncbi:MAG TPA: GNAT family N-acetyltransferase [Chloroflexota bacterium]|nr:GNAT family N-acetyltransferase [Chloroflexota bacterium]
MILTDQGVTRVESEIPPGWTDFVAASDGATIYHDAAWLEVIARTYGFQPRVFTLTNGSGEIGAILPTFLVTSRLTGRRLISLPYTNAAGPLHRPGVDDTPLLDAAIELARKEACRYVEVRGQPGQDTTYPEFERSSYFESFLLNLEPGRDPVRASFDKRARRGIARSIKSGVAVRFGADLDAVRAFYQLNLLTRRKHGVPPQPFTFFQLLWEALRPRGAIEILLAELDRRVVAGMVLLVHRDRVTYAYGASDQRYLRYAPNHALFDAAIGWSIERGFRSFDFGRTSPDNPGLLEFKRQWGARRLSLPYYYWPRRDGFVGAGENGLKYRCFTALWRRLPLGATSILGPALYRNLA